jgi:hypothetical protein
VDLNRKARGGGGLKGTAIQALEHPDHCAVGRRTTPLTLDASPSSLNGIQAAPDVAFLSNFADSLVAIHSSDLRPCF